MEALQLSCTIEVYDIVKYRTDNVVFVHTNLGYMHYTSADGAAGLCFALGWQYRKGKRKTRYDSWLRDDPPECRV